VDGDITIQCEQISHVPPWTFIRLKPLNNIDIRETIHDFNQEVEFETKSEEMVDDLVVRDNVVVCESSVIDESF
jgi:hypothetical protein